MTIAKIEIVRPLMAEYEHRIRSVVDRAWTEWVAYPGRAKTVFVGRLRAVIIFDAIARFALEEFEGDKNVHVVLEKQTVKFLFKNQVFARFKKGNSKGIGSNIETGAVLDFIDPQRTIPGLLPDVNRIEICYSHNDLGLELSEVAIVARDLKKRVWGYPIERTAPGAEIVPMPKRAPDISPPSILPRKRAPKQDQE